MAQNAAGDFPVLQPPEDTVQCLRFSPQSNFLCGGSWDNQVRVWEVQTSGQTLPKAGITHEAPVLCVDWCGDGSRVYSGGCDKVAKMWTLATNTPVTCGQHDGPISGLSWVEESQFLMTGSWDQTLRYWDSRQANPMVHSQQLQKRVFCMDVRFPLAVVGTADRQIVIFDLRRPSEIFKMKNSPLKYQSRCVSVFYDRGGYALGSIEGRVAIESFDPNVEKTFTFKCHRSTTEIYPINGIAFHPLNTFATIGGDGQYVFWDKEHKQRIKPFAAANVPLTCCAFNHDGTIFAYASGYDWSKGASFFNAQQHAPRIMLHAVREDDVKPRQPTKSKKKYG